MNPENDIVCNLLETPFNRWKEEDKKDILSTGRPTYDLSLSSKKEVKKSGRAWNVHFQSSWFVTYKWLSSSHYLQKLFCWPCLLFLKKYSVWGTEGFSNMLNVSRSLHKHNDSGEHIKCVLLLRNFEKNQNTIADAFRENAKLYKVHFNEKVRLNRLFLTTVIDAVFYLAKQELAFRGNDERSDSINRGHFKELLTLLLSKCSLEIQQHHEKIKSIFSGDSETTQNEIIDCISDFINDYVNNEIDDTNFFSFQVDDITEITHQSQCSIIIRYINSEGILVERFLGFHDLSEQGGTSSENLFSLLDKILEKFDYKHKLVGQSYDGASAGSGHLNDLQKKIKEKAPQALFVHCLDHRLNLVLQQSLKNISKCRIFFANLSGIAEFFHHSAERTYTFSSTSAKHTPTITEIHRWSSNSKLVNVVVEDWNRLKEVFEYIINSNETDPKSVRLADGLLNNLNDFGCTFLAMAFDDIFSVTDGIFDILQKKSLDINYCISYIKQTRDVLNNKRNDTYFNTLFDKANSVTFKKRQTVNLSQEEITEKYKILFYEILDHILMEMNIRFEDCEKLLFLSLGDTTKFPYYEKCFPSAPFYNLLELYGEFFLKNQRLKNELVLIFAEKRYKNISLQELVKKLNESKDVFTEAYKLFSLILTLPLTSVSVDDSCLKRLKSFLRNTKSQERLNSLANISIQKELLLEIMKKQPFHEEIIEKFAALKDQRIDLVYKV